MKKNKPKYKQIIDAAVMVIAENGYHHAQVSKIAKRAGVADGTIYLYFKNKEDILISIFEEKMGLFIEKINGEIAGKSTAIEKLTTLVEMHFKHFSGEQHWAVVTQLELRQSNQELRKKINEILREYLDLIDLIIIEGKQNQEFKPELDVRLARQMVFGTIDEIVTSWVMKGQKFNITANSSIVAHMLVNGLSADG
ncbi:TetR/AcrR family transcriptional regulator [Bacillus solimangrovi]|uniref:TetR family transcriptional regulator n=1 Tax=Bacillus solimangrovi TaxID=1305675 RepID=A0A1E5LCX4_9BACI|nr:TetR/AcrR family transcriptional regulator [Bacillus solimangrovi]OEH91924.1 TetR family transcriptional regulator [Bacillus solimangrovi]